MARLVYAEGYGCPSNDYDLRIILSRFKESGYRRTWNPAEASVVVVNTCAVKKRTEDRILSRLRFFEESSKAVVVAGCLPMVNPRAVRGAIPNHVAMISPSSIDRIDEVLAEDCNSKRKDLTMGTFRTKLGKAPIDRGSIIEVIPIAEGCLGECAFCCTRLARQKLTSNSPDSVVDAIRLGAMQGANEFWLTGQDVGAYGRDIGFLLQDLLSRIGSIEGCFRIRVGMINPEWCIEDLNGLVNAFRDPRIFKFLHIPLQSGNDEVLKTMNRKYTARDFAKIVHAFKAEYPQVTVWTDIICGYPSENHEAFEDTLRLLSELGPDKTNISKFSARPGTPANRLKPIPTEVVKERSRKASLQCTAMSLSRNRLWLGWTGEAFIDESGKKGTIIGRTDTYKPVVLPGHDGLLGQRVSVRVVDVRPTHLIGELLISN